MKPARGDLSGRDLPSPAWTTEHYADAVLYDHEYRRRRADVNWYRARVAEAGRAGEVLELGCGSGRVLVPLVRDGHRVVGVDAAQPMLARCAARLAHLPAAARARARLVRADFRNLPFSRRWKTIICPFNAMQHLYTRADVGRFLDGVRSLLAPGGRFHFDVLNPDLAWLTRDPHRRWSRTKFKHPETGRTYFYSTNHVYEAATQIAYIRLYYDEDSAVSRRGITRTKVVHLAHRQFFPEELALLLEHHGLVLLRRDGGFHGEEFTGDAESQVCTCSI